MLSSALISLGVAGSALAWPGFGSSRHSSIARAVHARQELVTAKPKEPVAATWFASWHADEFSLANYTTVSYSFALTTPNISFVNISDPEVFKDFVSTAHANNVSATISIGGWTGSIYFSSAVATAENRTEFVKTMVNLLNDNKLDGLSFDWEYPGAAGIGCNTNSPNDTANFLLFLQELRTALPNATLSAATSINPFISADGTPSTNVSDFASVFDYIQIMNYDIWGPWSDTTGPNAPLNDTCATNATQKVGSAVSAVEAWTKAGFPADQIVLGVAGYGHGFSVTPANALNDSILNPYSTFNKSFTPPGDAWDDMPVGPNGTVALDVCGNPQAQGGNWDFWGLVENGFLNENGTANTAEGIVYKFDECSQTPFVYNQTSGVFVAFDNAESFAAKGKFINATGLRGFAMWEAGGDFDDILLDSIRSAAGFPEVIEDEDDCEDDGSDNGVQTGNGNSSSGGSGSSNNSGAGSSNNSGSSGSGSSNNSGSSNSGGSSSNNSGSGSSNNSGSTSGNASGNTSGNTSSGNTSSGNNSSGGSASSTPSTGSNSSNNSGSNNSGSTTSPSVPDDEDEDDEECEDDEYPETPVTSTVNPTYPSATATASASSIVVVQPEGTPTAIVSSSSAPQPSATAAPDAGITDDDDEEECEDDDEIIDGTASASVLPTTTGTSSAASTIASTSASTEATASATSSAATVSETSASASETGTESATASTSTGSSSATASATESSSVQPIPTESSATTVSESSTPAPTSVSASASASSTEPALSAEPTSTASAESTPVAESTSAAASSASASAEPTSVEPTSSAAPTSVESASAEPTSVESASAEPSAPESSAESTAPMPTPSAEPSSSASLSAPVFEPTRR
ncbi:Glycoside hydrolase family 18 protein, partial [Rhizoctonia solani]